MFDKLKMRNLEMGDFFTMTFQVYKNMFISIAIVSVLFSLPTMIVNNCIQNNIDNIPPIIIVGNLLLSLVLAVMINSCIIMASARFIENGEKLKWNELINEATKLLLKTLPAFLLFIIGMTLGIVLLIIPGVIIAVYYGFYLHAIAIRKKGFMAAFKYSSSLAKGNFWKILGFALVTNILVFFALSAASTPISFFLTLQILQTGKVVIPMYVSVLEAFFTVITAFAQVGMTVMFLNLENVKRYKENEERNDCL